MPVYVDPTNAKIFPEHSYGASKTLPIKFPDKRYRNSPKKYQWKTVAVSTKTRMKRVYKEAYESCDSL